MISSMRDHGFSAHCITSPCPVTIVEEFLGVGNNAGASPLFRHVQNTKRVVHLRKEQMSYSCASKLIKRELPEEGLDPAQFGVYSLHSGGTSADAALGVPDRFFQRHGGWCSEKVNLG